MDLSRKVSAGSKDSVVSRAADRAARQAPSPGPRPHRIEYTRTPAVAVSSHVLERHRIAVVTNNVAADAFRLLRTQLLQEMRKNGWQTLAVTSPNQGAGKSTLSLNLAISIGMEVNYTALLVDADMRAPDLRRKLDLAPGPGLADYLLGKSRLEDLLIHPNIGNLVLLPGGAPVDNTSELMGSPMMAEMVRELRSRYPNRLIVFDVPANLSGADTLALSSFIDATILIVEELRTTPDEVERACELLRHSNLIGIVLNKSRELPRSKPSRRPQSDVSPQVAATRHHDAAEPTPPNMETQSSEPGRTTDHRNGVARVGHPTTTALHHPNDRPGDAEPAELAPASRISMPLHSRPLLVLFVGLCVGLFIAAAAWTFDRSGMIPWPTFLSLPAVDFPVK